MFDQANDDRLMTAAQQYPMSNVRWLKLSLDIHPGEEMYCGSSRPYMHWSQPLLAQMANLVWLDLAATRVNSLPLMPQLKHLAIELAQTPLPEEAQACIAALPSLETLHLRSDYMRKSPFLDLAASPRLRHVAFVEMVPCKVLLPAATKLTVESDYWFQELDGLAAVCHGLHLHTLDRLCFSRMHSLSFQHLTAFTLKQRQRFYKFCSGTIPAIQQVFLGSNFPQLRFLMVDTASDLGITLALPNLSILILRGRKLELEIENLESTGTRLEAMHMQWRYSDTMEMVGASLRQVCSHEILEQSEGMQDGDQSSISFNVTCGFWSDRHLFSHCDFASGSCGACMTNTAGKVKSTRICCPHGYCEPS